MGSDDGSVTTRMYLMTPNCTPNGYSDKFYVIDISLQFLKLLYYGILLHSCFCNFFLTFFSGWGINNLAQKCTVLIHVALVHFLKASPYVPMSPFIHPSPADERLGYFLLFTIQMFYFIATL